MSFSVFVDASSNLPKETVEALNIRVLPCSYSLDGQPGIYTGDLEQFDSHAYYDRLRAGAVMKTSLLNMQLFLDSFRPELEAGRDLIYVGMSSGISGTIQAARLAAGELMAEFPDRTVGIIDSLGAGLGAGLLACRAADLRQEGLSAARAGEILDREVGQLLQYFTVDDLNFLKRTGRVSGATAAIGTVLSIKPILWGDPTGHIVACSKVRGRKKALDALVELYREKAVHPETRRVAISHGDCPEEAGELARRIREICPPGELILCPHEPFTGAHVGPGMLALFFFGEKRA